MTDFGTEVENQEYIDWGKYLLAWGWEYTVAIGASMRAKIAVWTNSEIVSSITKTIMNDSRDAFLIIFQI